MMFNKKRCRGSEKQSDKGFSVETHRNAFNILDFFIDKGFSVETHRSASTSSISTKIVLDKG